jgi:hypothetical protein
VFYWQNACTSPGHQGTGWPANLTPIQLLPGKPLPLVLSGVWLLHGGS